MNGFHLKYLAVAQLSLLVTVSCGLFTPRGGTSEGIQESEKNDLRKIRENYKPSDCFLATFDLEVKSAGNSAQKARGVLLADTVNDRMSFVFKDRVFGFVINRVVVADRSVFIDNPMGKNMLVPLEHFEMSGLGNNSIRFPFRLFRNLVFGRLPDDLFSDRARIARKETLLTVDVPEGDSRYRYEFLNNRLSHLSVTSGDTGEDTVDVTLNGRFQDTVYPEELRMDAGRSGQVLESMIIRFTGLDGNARCPASRFSMPARVP